jgi:uncharacterized protein (DUF305 family)
MDARRLQRRGLIGLVLLALAPAARTVEQDHDSVVGFRSLMNEATARMHDAMHMPFTGDADRDFARMMIPHHQGAIDMARIQLKYGRDERLRRLAQSIVVEQAQEIAYLRMLLETPPPDAAARTTRQ